ncbi:MAG: peptidoglycan-binding protein [Jatrophihabitantaceae bacterium]
MLARATRLQPAAPNYRRRRNYLIAVAAGATLLAIGGLIGALWVRSPAQQAADTRPPSPTVLSAAVVRQVVASTVVLRGTVSAGNEYQVNPTGATPGGQPIITAAALPAGHQVIAGQVLVEVSGRPVIALAGSIPAYRDLKPGAHGRDVRQLQTALQSLGYSTDPDPAASFGAGTKSALTQLYGARGYDVPTTDGGASVQAAQHALDTAQRSLDDLLRSAPPTGAASAGNQASAVANARAELAAAQARYDQAQSTNGPMLPLAEVEFLPSFPAYVAASNAGLGTAAKAPMLTLSTGSPVVIGRLDPAAQGLVRTGMPVAIDAETTGFTDTGRLNSIGAAVTAGAGSDSSGGTGGQQDAASYLPASITPTKPLSAALIGQDVRLTITAAATKGPVLAVPESAITTSADGRTFVVVLDGDRRQTRVPVTAGISGAGLVSVTALSGGLAAGDQVVVGQ